MLHVRKAPLSLVIALSMLFGVALTASAFAYQSHMWYAKGNLNSALSQLNMAVPDKAGHRVQAIRLVNQAIWQVNAGIAAGAR